MRIRSLSILFFLLAAVLILNLFYLQVIGYDYWFKLSRQNAIRIVPNLGMRGKILDRNGKIIADSKARFNIAVIPQEIKNKQLLFDKLSILLNIPVETISKRFKRGYLNPFSPVIIEVFVDKEKAIILEQSKEELPGVLVQTDFYRVYPYGYTAAHIIGYVSKISKKKLEQFKTYGYMPELMVGYSGVEEQDDFFLQSEPGGASYEVNSLSKAVRLLGIKPAVAGSDLKLTIDIELQEIVQRLINGHRGAVVIMDYHTGELLTMASSPSFDPNIFIIQDDPSKITRVLSDETKPMLNRAISGEYSPGSTFKIIVAIAGLQSGQIDINDRVYCDGSIQIGGKTFVCWGKHGSQNVEDAIANSCNIFFYRLGLKLGAPAIAKYAQYFGLNRKTGIDIPYERAGFIPGVSKYFLRAKRQWYGGDTVNMSIGQGEVLTTPIQLVSLIAAIANGGRYVYPHLHKDNEAKNKSTIINIDKPILEIVRKGLRRVVSDESGTAHILAIEGFEISGKTGTVQVHNAENHGWFIGYLNKPSWAVCVFLENVGGSYAACRLLKDILQEFKREGIIAVYE